MAISVHCFPYEGKLIPLGKNKKKIFGKKKFMEHLAYGTIYFWYSAVFPNCELSYISNRLVIIVNLIFLLEMQVQRVSVCGFALVHGTIEDRHV